MSAADTGSQFLRFFDFLGIDTLIRNKRAVGRHVDLSDVEELVRIKRER